MSSPERSPPTAGTERRSSGWSRTFSRLWRDKASSTSTKLWASGVRSSLQGEGGAVASAWWEPPSVWPSCVSHRSAIYASRLYLNQYHTTHPERLASNEEGGPKISGTKCLWALSSESNSSFHPFVLFFTGNVYIHPTANIDPTAVVSLFLNPDVAPPEPVKSKFWSRNQFFKMSLFLFIFLLLSYTFQSRIQMIILTWSNYDLMKH